MLYIKIRFSWWYRDRIVAQTDWVRADDAATAFRIIKGNYDGAHDLRVVGSRKVEGAA